MAIKPITPKEVVSKKAAGIPDAVFEAFNELIAEGWDGSQSVVKQNVVMDRVLSRLNVNSEVSFTREMVLDRHWLDVEEIYRSAGWNVEYDRPGYNETYGAVFIFTKRVEL
jgi:hypothetical protein